MYCRDIMEKVFRELTERKIHMDFFEKKPFTKATLLVMTAAILLLSGCGLFPDEEEELPPPLVETKKVEYLTMPVPRETIENSITGYASIVAEHQTDVYFENASGRLKKLYFEQGDHVEAGDLMCELDNSDLMRTLQESEMRYEISELVFARAQTQRKNGELDDISWKTAQLNIFIARRDIDELRQKYAETQLFAPTSGTVTYMTETSIGAGVSSGTVVYTIADTADLAIRYSSIGYDEIPLGAKVTFKLYTGDVNATPETFSGTVVETPKSVASNASYLQKQSVLILPDEPFAPDVAAGMNADIIFVKQRSGNCLAIPRTAVHTLGTRTYVYVLVDGYKQERDVKIGITNSSRAEVLEGLSEGELLIY